MTNVLTAMYTGLRWRLDCVGAHRLARGKGIGNWCGQWRRCRSRSHASLEIKQLKAHEAAVLELYGLLQLSSLLLLLKLPPEQQLIGAVRVLQHPRTWQTDKP